MLTLSLNYGIINNRWVEYIRHSARFNFLNDFFQCKKLKARYSKEEYEITTPRRKLETRGLPWDDTNR